jgi:hypothetical protein
MDIALLVVLGAAALFALDRLFLWMERRGWVYWRKSKRRGGGGDVLTGFGFMDPGTQHLDEARREHVIAEKDDGDDDGQRKKSDRVT